ncbi:MAG: hypothetical protein H6722_07905 [Sandaracinus sp.]|nr:hypothetical protein [Sandaracinus sp.]
MKRVAFLFASVWLACTTPGTSSTTTPRRTTPRLQVRTLQVEHVALPSDGLVHLALWIDAGSFDADPPAAATLAAWAVEGEGLTARATPDGIELTVRGRAEALDALLARLAGALATRHVAQHDTLAERLVDARRRTLAAPSRRADELALRQLLGPGVSPLEGTPSRGEVESFLAATFGPERALLVAIGDVPTERLQDAVARAFERAPSARGLRASALEPTARLEPERGPREAATVAVSFPSVDEAWGFARALAPETHGVLVFPHRGGATALLRTDTGELSLLATQARLAPVRPRALPDAADLRALAERRGLAWLAERHDATLTRHVAIGALCPDEDGDACLASFARAHEEPEVRDENGRATAVNGARVFVEPREGALALALRFATGGDDPATAGVLASALAARCATEPVLDQVAPEVDARGFAVQARADAAAAEEAVAALVRCTALSNARDHERLRLRALEERRRSPERGWLAHALAPGAVSTVLPRGDARALARPLAIRDALREHRVGARTTLAIVGPVSNELATFGARLLAFLPAGSATSPTPWGEATPLLAERFESSRVRIALGWRTDEGGPGAGVVARAFAESIVLGDEAEVRWREGGEGPTGGAWAAVAFDVAPDHVDAVIERARAATGPNAEALVRALDRERWGGADARVAASRLVRTGDARPVLPAQPEAVVRALKAGAFVMAVGRSQRAGAWNRR